MNQDFKPVLCPKCAALIWAGISWAGFARRLDTPVLTIEEEVIKRIAGLMTYEIFRTRVSFEAVERSVNRIRWAKGDKNRVILGDHQCLSISLFASVDDAPDYWKKEAEMYLLPQEAPF